MAVRKETLLDEVKAVMLQTAKKMMEANSYPSSDLQVQIINSANELVRTAADIEFCKEQD